MIGGSKTWASPRSPPPLAPTLSPSPRSPTRTAGRPRLSPNPPTGATRSTYAASSCATSPLTSRPPDLARFLESGPEPVYIGFGSIVIDDPARVTRVIQETCRRLGVRVIISRGWSKLGGDDPSTDDVFYLGDCPHGM